MCFFIDSMCNMCKNIKLMLLLVSEVATLREQLEGIKVRGKGCPKPIKIWAQCGVSKKVLEVLRKSVILFI